MSKNYLGKYAHLRGKTVKKEVAAAAPRKKGIAGKGMPQTCNYKISDNEFERELREYQASLAAENAAQADGDGIEVSADNASE